MQNIKALKLRPILFYMKYHSSAYFVAMRRNPETDFDGMFLIRDSTASNVDFSLSFVYERRIFHFYIKRTRECYYVIDGGPVVQGWCSIL